ncbi:hypothetical protein LXL04_000038 [Taraxacum kok-saghyz]
MEQNLLSTFEENFKNPTKISLKPLSIARTLIVNPSTSDETISSILQNLMVNPPELYHLHVITLLCEISILRSHFSPRITTILHSHSHSHSLSPNIIALCTCVSEMTEGLFLSLCFGSCVSVRQKLLSDVEMFDVRPSLLLTVLTGFAKDPYPYVRKAALDGLIGLCKYIVVEDPGMIQGCYLRAVELLFDTEESVRCSAVQMVMYLQFPFIELREEGSQINFGWQVSEWGKLLVANSDGKSKRDCSDALYVQLCSMVRDMSMNVRIEAYNALSKLQMASEYILLQTLSKKVLPNTLHGQLSTKHSSLPASTAAGAFLHGLEDEFHQVRSCACYAMKMPAILSAKFASEALGLLMDVLNDDSVAVRLQALETVHHMAVYGHLQVQEKHMHMFLGALVDMNKSIRFTARKVLRLTKLHNLDMFTLVIDNLIQSLEKYPLDEPDILSLLFDIGRNHGKFAVSITNEIFPEVDPTCECNWDLNSLKTTAHLVLAISVPLSNEMQQHDDIIPLPIPSIMFSYAVTVLGRVSRSLSGVMNQDTLLSYLTHYSRSSGVNPIEFIKGKEEDKMVEDDVAITCPVSVRLDMVDNKSNNDFDKADDYVKLILGNVVALWDLVKFGCIDEVIKTLRSWNEELARVITNQPDCLLTFTLRYLKVVKLLSKAWCHIMDSNCIKSENLGYVLQKLETKLRELQHRFIGLSIEEKSHIQELTLVACTLKSCIFDESTKKKLESFSIKEIVTINKRLKYMEAEVEMGDNNWLNPYPFVAGLPVGIPLKMRLHNVPVETKLWVKMRVCEKLREYVFVDLKQFEGCDGVREFTFVPLYYRTPKVDSFVLRVCVGMECLSEEEVCGPKHELVYLCKEKEVFFSMVVKKG